MNNPQATKAALDILRSGEPFQWYVITLLALVVYVYVNEMANKNWRGIAAGLSLYTPGRSPVGRLAGVNALALLVFAGLLKWI